MALESVEIKLALLCPACNAAIPLNGISKVARCSSCQEVTPLEGRFRWEELLNYKNPPVNVFKATLTHKPGMGENGAWVPVKLSTRRVAPRCPHCEEPIHLSSFPIKLVPGIDHPVICPNIHCHRTIQAMAVPDYFATAFPMTLWVIGGYVSMSSPAAREEIKATKPVVLSCMSCGGTLRVDGTNRIVVCEFCSSNNFLPDALWLFLHPRPKMTPWYIIFKK